jgi:hypothetical protein
MRSILSVCLLSLLLASTAPAQAASDHRPAGLFDDRIKQRQSDSAGSLPLALEQVDTAGGLRHSWEQFRSRHGGGWTIYLDEKTAMPTLVAGRGIEWFAKETFSGESLNDLEARARLFLAENIERLGDWSGMIELDRKASFSARNGHRQLVFRQVVDGTRVENARIEFHLKQGRLIMFGASSWGAPTTSGIPSLDAAKARAALDEYIYASTLAFEQEGAPELAMIASENEESLQHDLIWRFRFRDPAGPALWTGEVDAHDGSIRAFYDGTDYAAVRGGVFPFQADGDCAAGGCEIAGFPMPFADYTEDGEPEEYADAYGNLMCSISTASFETNLSGPYVNVSDACGAVAEFGSCEDGLDLGLKHGENCDVAPGSSAGNTAAARNTFYHVNRAAELARFYDPTNVWLQSPLTVNVNLTSSCNANWSGSVVNMYGAGGNCNNTGEMRNILIHEWGHGYDHNDGGGVDKPGEAYSDIIGILASRDSCMSRGIYIDGSTCTGYGDTCLSCTGFREFDWTARTLNTAATPTGFAQNSCPPDYTQFAGPCRREAHCESYISSEAIYDLVTRDLPAAGMDLDSAWQLVERLWYETRPGSGGDAYRCYLPLSNSCDATSWYQKMRVADDDDGDLANGTPHAAELYAAFARHDIACGSAGAAENQSTSSCPTLAAPLLTVAETPSGTELSWGAVPGAAEYRVYRGELGCNGQQVPVAALTGGETTYLDTIADQDFARVYRIEAFGSNPACHSPVSNCAETPLVATLHEQGHRLAGAGQDGDDLPEPGETVELPVTLFNSGGVAALSIGGQLQLNGPAHVRLLNGDANWADLAPSATAESVAPHFELVILEQASCSDILELEITVQSSNAPTLNQPLQIPMGGVDCEPVTCPEPTPTEAPGLTVAIVDNGGELDLLLSWDPVAGAPFHHVLQSTSAPFDAGVELLKRTASGTEHTIPDGVNTTPDLTFFEVRATNSCNQEGP